MQLILILEIKLQKEHFSEKYQQFFSYWSSQFGPLLGSESTYIYYDLRIQTQGIYVKKWEYKTSNWYTIDLHLGN